MSPLLQTIVTAFVQFLVGMLLWLAFRRGIERQDVEMDQLRSQVTTLRDDRIARMEREHQELVADNNLRHAKEADSRRELHVQIAAIQRDYVTHARLGVELERLTARLEEFRGLTADLARVGETIRGIANQVSTLNDQVIATMRDVARMQGEIKP